MMGDERVPFFPVPYSFDHWRKDNGTTQPGKSGGSGVVPLL